MAIIPLELKIISAKGLNRVNLVGKMEVYAVVYITGARNQDQKQKTSVDRDGDSNPNWNHPMKFMIDEHAALQNQLTLVVEIKAGGVFGDKDVGEVHVPVKELMEGYSDGGKPLQFVSYQVRKPNGKPKGELNFSYMFGAGVGKVEEPVTAYPTGIHNKLDEPVVAYPAVNSGTSSLYPPVYTATTDASSGIYPPPVVADSGTYPPAGGAYYPPPAGYAQSQAGYGYPYHQSGYSGYPPPPPMGYGGYPPQVGYGYPPVVQPQKPQNNNLGLGLGAGLLGGVLGGLLIGDIVSDVGGGGCGGGF